jgi:outer membrane protein assembly factor BamA
MKIKGLAVLIFFFYSSCLLAEEPPVDLFSDEPINLLENSEKKGFIVAPKEEGVLIVKDIRVEGIQRTEAGTVFSYLPIKVGDSLTKQKATDAIKALYSTGFF